MYIPAFWVGVWATVTVILFIIVLIVFGVLFTIGCSENDV